MSRSWRPDRASTIRASQAGYAAAHLADDKGLGLLGKRCGSTWAERYIGDVLFPRESFAAC